MKWKEFLEMSSMLMVYYIVTLSAVPSAHLSFMASSNCDSKQKKTFCPMITRTLQAPHWAPKKAVVV